VSGDVGAPANAGTGSRPTGQAPAGLVAPRIDPARTVAALYVETGGCYFGLPGVEPWDEKRDARLYDGPHPVVAHPPCQRWGRYWFGGPSAKVRMALGDDGGCFAAALAAVRNFGGVLEHPEGSHAWRHFHLNIPPRNGTWVVADWDGGWTCCVEQGAYGHQARKATWLYANGVELPSLDWGKAPGEFLRMEDSYHSAEERRLARQSGRHAERQRRSRLSDRARAATPHEFRELLLSIARTASSERIAA
jgi:hypothetical protein